MSHRAVGRKRRENSYVTLDEREDEPTDNVPLPAAAPSFEQALTRLERIVGQLEEGELGLAEALARYEEGVGLLRQCYGLLERAERRVEILCSVDPQQRPATAPFNDEPTADLEEKAQNRSRRRTSRRTASEPSTEAPADAVPTRAPEPRELF